MNQVKEKEEDSRNITFHSLTDHNYALKEN